MSRAPLFVLVSIATIGCKPPVEAPADLNELSLYLFENFSNEGTDELAAGALNLEAQLSGLDLTGDVDDRSWSLTTLSGEQLGDLTATPGADASNQLPVAVAAQFEGSMDDQLGLILDSNQVCIVGDGYVYYDREFTSDTACFEDGSCELLQMTNVARYESFLANVWLQEKLEARRVELEDGRVAIIERGWIEEAFYSDSGDDVWEQRYGLDFYLPKTDGGSEMYRFFAFWSSADIGGVGDDAYASLAVSGIEDGFVNENAFVAGEDCDNDRQGDYESPF